MTSVSRDTVRLLLREIGELHAKTTKLRTDLRKELGFFDMTPREREEAELLLSAMTPVDPVMVTEGLVDRVCRIIDQTGKTRRG